MRDRLMIDNYGDVERVNELMTLLSTDGPPWGPSERDRFIGSLLSLCREGLTRAKHVNSNEAYMMLAGGGIYAESNGVHMGYFKRGSFAVFGAKADGKRQADLYGTVFHVTQSASIANTPAKWVEFADKCQGRTHIAGSSIYEVTGLLPLTEVIKALESYLGL